MAQYSDPYEEWKAGGKQGGSYDAWKQSQQPQQQPQQQAAPQQSQQGGGGQQWNYDTEEGRNQFRQWYNQQQGGNRPEDMARFGWTGNEYGQGNQSGDTFKRWDPYLIREGEMAGKYRSSRGAEGYYDKPTECPPGMVPSGPSENDPCVPSGGGGGYGGGGGGGYGGGGGRGGRGGPGRGNDIYDYLKRTGLESASDPEKALSTFMGYGGAGAFQAQIDAANREAQSLPPGPARDAAIARLTELKQTGLAQMRQAASQAARGDLTGMLGTEQGYAQLAENARQANMQNQLGWGGLGLQRELGLGGLDLQNRQFGWQSGQQWRDILAGQGADRDLQRYLAEQQLKAGQPSGLQKALGIGGSALGIAGSAVAIF